MFLAPLFAFIYLQRIHQKFKILQALLIFASFTQLGVFIVKANDPGFKDPLAYTQSRSYLKFLETEHQQKTNLLITDKLDEFLVDNWALKHYYDDYKLLLYKTLTNISLDATFSAPDSLSAIGGHLITQLISPGQRYLGENLPYQDLFIGLFLIINYASVTVISAWNITKIYTGILAISLLVPIKWYRKKLTINIYEFFLLGLLGYAPLLTGSYFATNYLTSYNEHSEIYKIESVEMHTFYSDLILENDTLSEYALLTCFDSRDSSLYKGRTKAKYTFEYGGLGLKILIDKRAIP